MAGEYEGYKRNRDEIRKRRGAQLWVLVSSKIPLWKTS